MASITDMNNIGVSYDTTQPVDMDDMIYHCKAVRRGAPNRFIVGDMPFGSYEESPEFALKNAMRFVKEVGWTVIIVWLCFLTAQCVFISQAGVDAVKLEGGAIRASTVRKIVDSGIAVMGHVGLTPQGVSVLGGFRAQGRTAQKAKKILDDAMALQKAGAFAVVIECVPEIVARAVTGSLKVFVML
jgi:3-methyl-2-oxobutanoate hydroxymethyltransferase